MGIDRVFYPKFKLNLRGLGGTKYAFWLLLGILIAGTVLGILVVIFAQRGTSPAARMTRCSMGFFVSIVWIMAIADEVVHVLQV